MSENKGVKEEKSTEIKEQGAEKEAVVKKIVRKSFMQIDASEETTTKIVQSNLYDSATDTNYNSKPVKDSNKSVYFFTMVEVGLKSRLVKKRTEFSVFSDDPLFDVGGITSGEVGVAFSGSIDYVIGDVITYKNGHERECTENVTVIDRTILI